MKILHLLLATALSLAPLTPVLALDRLLPTPRIKDNGDIRLSDDVKIGRFQGRKYIATPDAVETPSVTVTGPDSTGDLSKTSIKAKGGSRARSQAERAADTVNPLDFLQPGDDMAAILAGTADAAPAFNAAIASRPAGARVRLTVPEGTYRLGTGGVSNNGRSVTADLSSGARVGVNFGGTGPGALYVSRVEARTQSGLSTSTQGTGIPAENFAINAEYAVNNGGAASYGRYFKYENYNTSVSNVNGGDVANHVIGQWHERGPGSVFLQWDVGITPVVPENEASAQTPRTFAIVGREMNIAHNGPTSSWTEYDSRRTGADQGAPQWGSIGFSFVPDSWTPSGRKGGHVNIGYGVFPDALPNARSTPYVNATFSPFHVGNDAVAPGGRGMYFGGNTDGDAAKYAYAGIEARYNWPMFLNLEKANLTSGWIVNAKPGQSYRWATPAGDITLGADNSGKLLIAAPGGVSLPATSMTAYTPSAGAGSGSIATLGAVTGRFQQRGKMVDLTITVPITNNGSGGSYVYATLPPGMQAAGDFTLSGNENANATSKMLYGRVASDGYVVAIFNYDSSYPGVSGAKLQVSGAIEIK